jgi:hypothetical protein
MLLIICLLKNILKKSDFLGDVLKVRDIKYSNACKDRSLKSWV